MQEVTSDKLQIAYDGPALRAGTMSMLSLAAGLHGQALLIERAKVLLYGDKVNIRVEVDREFETGSFVIPVHIFYEYISPIGPFLTGQPFTALANLLGMLGFLGISPLSLYALFKRLKGRKIEKPEDVPPNLGNRVSIEDLIRLYNDPEVQALLRKILEPLRHEGIEEFQTRRQGIVIERVSRKDLTAADDAEIEDLTQDEEIELGIEKCAWRRDLAWHFRDGQTTFDARIEDDLFWKRIDAGEAFAEGDRLRVHLRTVANRTAQGKLKVVRSIPAVISVEHSRDHQRPLWPEEASPDFQGRKFRE